MSRFTLHEWIQQIETEIAASKVHNHFFRKEIANGIVSGIKIEMIEKGIQKLEWLKELQRYKDLEEQGRLIELPCKLGSDTYCVFGEYSFKKRKSLYRIEVLPFETDMLNGMGEKFFLTKAEAEARLAELKGLWR